LGAKKLILTNAAGGINKDFGKGCLMLITGHISSLVPSVLRGPNIEEFGVRFPDMTEVYSKALRELAKKTAKENGVNLKEGVYIQTQGPNYETPEEINAYRMWGADAVGMSTACEAIAARHMGMEICGISCITAEDIAQFKQHGYVCKLMGTAQKDENGITVCVQPTLIKQGEPAAAVPMNFNHISMTGTNAGTRSLFGQGAGRYPTAYNVVQDCIDVQNGIGFYTDKAKKTKADNTMCCRYYVRGAQDGWLEENTAEKWDQAVITKPVQICKMHSWLTQHKNVFIAALDD